jgi:hypothetical protein
VRDQSGACICPPGSGLDHNGDCINCPAVKGMKVDERGRCVCDLERGMVVDERGNCICPVEFGYVLDRRGYCVKSDQPPPPECVVDSDCPDNRYCEQKSNTCQDPCGIKRCGINAFCNATNHRAICQCISGYSGDPEVLCSKFKIFKTSTERFFLNVISPLQTAHLSSGRTSQDPRWSSAVCRTECRSRSTSPSVDSMACST